MMRSIAFPVWSISRSSVFLPNEKRMAELARSFDKPMPSKTCEATTEPTMQADPLDAQTPSKSRAMSKVSELKPGKLTFKRVGEAMVDVSVLYAAWNYSRDLFP